MTLKRLLPLVFMIHGYSCISQSVDQRVNAITKAPLINVTFFVDGKKIKIDNHFSFTIIHDKDTIKTRIKGHRIYVPKLMNLLDYSITFKYKEYSLTFKRISKKMLFPDQNYTWEFGVDNRPFDESLDLLSSQEYESEKKIRQLQYLRLQPMESGDGLRFINLIDY